MSQNLTFIAQKVNHDYTSEYGGREVRKFGALLQLPAVRSKLMLAQEAGRQTKM